MSNIGSLRMSCAWVLMLGVAWPGTADDEPAAVEEAAPPVIAMEGNEARRALLDPMHGQPAPPLALSNWINSDALSWESLEGKVVLLDFWGVWCGPCRAAVPYLKELYEAHKDDGFVLIGVHTSSAAEQAPAYIESEGITYPIGFDMDDKVVAAYQVDSFPDYYLVDHTGTLRYADIANADFENVRHAVTQALADRREALGLVEAETPAEETAPADDAPAEVTTPDEASADEAPSE